MISNDVNETNDMIHRTVQDQLREELRTTCLKSASEIRQAVAEFLVTISNSVEEFRNKAEKFRQSSEKKMNEFRERAKREWADHTPAVRKALEEVAEMILSQSQKDFEKTISDCLESATKYENLSKDIEGHLKSIDKGIEIIKDSDSYDEINSEMNHIFEIAKLCHA